MIFSNFGDRKGAHISDISYSRRDKRLQMNVMLSLGCTAPARGKGVLDSTR
jgi:hypothetical protein